MKGQTINDPERVPSNMQHWTTQNGSLLNIVSKSSRFSTSCCNGLDFRGAQIFNILSKNQRNLHKVAAGVFKSRLDLFLLRCANKSSDFKLTSSPKDTYYRKLLMIIMQQHGGTPSCPQLCVVGKHRVMLKFHRTCSTSDHPTNLRIEVSILDADATSQSLLI